MHLSKLYAFGNVSSVYIRLLQFYQAVLINSAHQIFVCIMFVHFGVGIVVFVVYLTLGK